VGKRGGVDMRRGKFMTVVLLVGSLLFSGGCIGLAIGAAAGVGVGTYAFIKGELKTAYPYTYEETWSAALAAVDALELTKMGVEKDAFGGRIEAERATGKSIKISVKPLTSNSTSVKIRVGVFGHRAISETIASEIEAELGK
jgi:hypothetical protein